MAKPRVVLREVPEPQTTITQVRALEGRAAFVDGIGKVIFLPAQPDSGIVFKVGGLPDPVPAAFERLNTSCTHRTTALRVNGSLSLMTPEHLLAAVRGLGISNLRVVTNSKALITLLHGSALPFTDILARAEVVSQDGTSQ